MSEENDVSGTITITISENSVKYDSNMMAQDMIWWMEVVKSMVITDNLNAPKSE